MDILKGQKSNEKENYVPIQEYTGEGFTLRDSVEENLEIAEKHKDEVEEAVKQYFLDEYKTEVKVHNMVSNAGGVNVYVESIGEPHFYTFAIVPVDRKEEIVKTDRVWSLEGQVEKGIKGGLYAMAYKKEFSNLDQYLEKTVKKYPVVGTPIEAIENVMPTGYTTPYYFISPAGDVFKKLFNKYIENPDITGDEIRKFLSQDILGSKHIFITIEFYMEKSNIPPNKSILDEVIAEIESMENIPLGDYSIHLNDNYIDKRRAIGYQDNTIESDISTAEY